MIELKSLVLCDAATIRDGLLHILGAGIAVVWRTSFPDALLATVAASLEVSEIPEEGETHTFRLVGVRVGEEPEQRIFEAGLEVTVTSDGTSDHQSVPLVLNLSNAGIASEGRYEIRAFLDGEAVSAIHFSAKIAPDAPQVQQFA